MRWPSLAKLVLGLAASVSLLTACAGPPREEARPQWPPARFIVKARAPVADEEEVLRLVRAHLVRPDRVKLFRAMSGGAYVFEVSPPDARAEVDAIVRRRSASGAFEYVEVDAPATVR